MSKILKLIREKKLTLENIKRVIELTDKEIEIAYTMQYSSKTREQIEKNKTDLSAYIYDLKLQKTMMHYYDFKKDISKKELEIEVNKISKILTLKFKK